MLRTVHIEGFRSLKSIDVALEPLTVLVGPNGSGKSAFLDALVPVRKLLDSDFWQKRGDVGMRRSVVLANGQIREGVARANARHLRDDWTFARLDLDVREMRKPNTVEEATALSQRGENLANVYATLTRKEQERVAQSLCGMIPLFGDVAVRPLGSGAHRLVFQDRWNHGVWYEPTEVSDGTLCVLAFLVLGAQATRPQTVAIEHLEHAIHPFLLGRIIETLRSIAHSKDPQNQIQFILTTHSAELLNFCEPHEVRFFARDLDDGSTVVRAAPVDTEQWRAAWEEYSHSLGELWLSGGLGGVPGVAAE